MIMRAYESLGFTSTLRYEEKETPIFFSQSCGFKFTPSEETETNCSTVRKNINIVNCELMDVVCRVNEMDISRSLSCRPLQIFFGSVISYSTRDGPREFRVAIDPPTFFLAKPTLRYLLDKF